MNYLYENLQNELINKIKNGERSLLDHEVEVQLMLGRYDNDEIVNISVLMMSLFSISISYLTCGVISNKTDFFLLCAPIVILLLMFFYSIYFLSKNKKRVK